MSVSTIAPNGNANAPVSQGQRKLSRGARLLRRTDFERVYQQGRRHFSAHMTVFYLRRAEGEGLRVGFTVGRALGGAVERNRMKRRLREAFRLRRPVTTAPVDVVVNPKKSVLTAAFSELLNEVSRAFGVIQQKLEEKSSSRD